MSTDHNIDVIRRFLRMGEQGFHGDFNEYFTPDYLGYLSGQQLSLTDLIVFERGFAAAFSNVSYNVDEIFGVGDRVACRITTRAAHTGKFDGIGPTGRQIAIGGIAIYRFVEGRIAESWCELDMLGMFGQLKAA